MLVRDHFLVEPNPPNPMTADISTSACAVESCARRMRACSFCACLSAFFSSRRADSWVLTSASRLSKSNDFAADASLVFSRSNAIRARTCSIVERSTRVVCPNLRRSTHERQSKLLPNENGGTRTRSAVDVVQVRSRVLVRPVTRLAVETRLTRPAASRVLHNHRLAEILVQFERGLSAFHELGRLRQVFLAPLAGCFACGGVKCRCVEGEGGGVPCFMRASFSCMRSRSSSSFLRARSVYSCLSHFFRKSVSLALEAYAPDLGSAMVVAV